MIKIVNLSFPEAHKLEIQFSDGSKKVFDYFRLTGFVGSAQFLANSDFFTLAETSFNGRQLVWKNGDEVDYDNCADALRYYWDDESHESEGIDDSIGLLERIEIAKSKQLA